MTSRKEKILKEGMEIFAKPIGEKIEQMSQKVDEKIDALAGDMEVVYNTQQDINDHFDKRITDAEKKKLFDLNTVFDIKDEEVLEKSEQEYLIAYLMRLANSVEEINDEQQDFIRSIANYLDVRPEQQATDLSCVENLGTNKGSQAFLQVVMEFLFLKQCNFDFLEELEELEELFDYFNVNRRNKEDIKKKIAYIYHAVGKRGIAEKYGFVPKDEEVEQDTEETEQENPVSDYDGSDISRECADAVGENDYIELDNYLVYGHWREGLFKVSKQNGEKQEIDISKYASPDVSGCGWKQWYYFYNTSDKYRKAIYRINVEDSNEVEFLMDFPALYREGEFIDIKANDDYLIFSTATADDSTTRLFCYYLKEKRLEDWKWKDEGGYKIGVDNYYLVGDEVFFVSRYTLYKYNITNKELSLIQKDLDYNERDIFSKKSKYYNGIIYSVVSSHGINISGNYYFLDVKNPMSIQHGKMPGYGERRYWAAYGKIYYVTVNEAAEFGFYDIFTKEHKVLMSGCPIVKHSEGGRLIKKIDHICLGGKIVGKWLYYHSVGKGMLVIPTE